MTSTSKSSHEPIHSGHFMTSNPHSDELLPDEEVVGVVVEDDVVEHMQDDEQKVQDLRDLNVQDEKPVTFYKFGPKRTQSIAIDVSLNKLNKCIKVAYNKMTTPKWKDFKGLRLHWKQRIRLNNVIWRAYYMEFRRPDKDKSKRTPYCYFTVPDDDTTHVKLTGTVVEGMYWKRSMDALKAQYKRWRHLKTRKRRRRGISWNQEISLARQLAVQNAIPKNSSAEHPDTDDLDNEFTDTLFANLMQPYTFPNPKEIVQGCNADVMQPGLLSLQPSIEEIMASLDPPEQLLDEIGNYSASSVSATPPCTPKEYETTFSSFTNPTQQPTRQSSSISPQILLANSSAPTYSQAAYEHTPLIATMPYTTDSSSLDYVPQFLTTTMQFPSSVLPNRTWWINFPSTPTPSVLSSPSTPSVVHSPISSSTAVIVPSLSINTPTTASSLPAVETHLINTSNKDSSKVFPTSTNTLKFQTERWNVAEPSSLSPRGITTESMEHGDWKQLSSTTNTTSLNSLLTPQPLYPQENNQILTKVTAASSHEQSTILPSGTASIKQEHEKDERVHRAPKRGCRSVAADSTIEPVERKRILHLNAEQNRRCALKDGFEQLLNSLPNLYGCGTKPTNAIVLTRAAERIRHLKAEIALGEEKARELKQNIQRLNDKIASLQASLPSSSRAATSTISQKTEMEQFLERYTKERTRQDYRFWVMAKMMQPLMETLIERLSQLPSDRALTETSDWLQANFQPSVVRPNASSMLVYLATHAGMLSDPNALQDYIQRELSQQ
uniref:BHLH domain-containing protein n=1 Tax=Elaeophora elaphi TaxID=1147741 RepID=A0A0R3RU26_9BILA